MRLDDFKRQMQCPGATLLVPNQRAARAWRRRLFDPAMQTEPVVLPWGAWTAAEWQELLLQGRDDRILLNPLQNTELWTQVLQAAGPGTLRPIRSLVQLCTAAQHLLQTHGATSRILAFHGESGTDTAVFADWFRGYTDRCREERLLPASAVDDALGAHVSPREGGNARAPIFLLGFDDLLPAQTYLLDQLIAAGTEVTSLDAAELSGIEPAVPILLRCVDEQHEWASLVHFLHEHTLGSTGEQDAATLVVLPDVERSRAALDRTLRSAFGDAGDASPQWEFAAGRPLATLPLAATALHLLRWTLAPMAADVVSTLLHSPYLDLRIDRERAGELDAEVLRDSRRLRPEWTMGALAHRAGSREPALHEVLQRLEATAAQQLRGRRLPGEWIAGVQTVLASAGWPGPRERSSIEFQMVDRWHDLLETLATLDLFNQPIPFATFLDQMEATAAETLFAAENTGAPIQIVSPSEAAGTTAGRLWFAHATEPLWNARRTPSPLLPWSLHAECGMPGTDPARDVEAHLRTTERLLASATSVTASHAGMNADGDLRPAAIFDRLPSLRREDASPTDAVEPASCLEQFVDDTTLPPLPDGIVHGGVGVLKDQAACAFRAFAQRRLFSSEPDTATLGLDPRQRGELLHYVLQLFWTEVKSQAELLRQQSTGELPATLQRHIDTALAAPATGDTWNAAYLDLQRRRLFTLLMKWFELEAKRPPFRVLYTEHEVKNVEVGPLQFNLRVDRIDEVERDGEPVLALIDYKTGNPTTGSWKGPRPGEPQLPLYAVAANLDHVGAIAFATVRPGDKNLGLRAMPAGTELLFPGKTDKKPEEFEAQMEEWYTTMHRLGGEFARGDARVGPKQYPGTCDFCGQRMLCRLNPELLQDLGNDDETVPETTD